jgi:GNAT superfamily N-acetyltransferase
MSRVVRVVEECPVSLADYARIPSAFEVRSVVDVVPHSDTGVYELRERIVTAPWVKDYDAIAGNHPTDWPARFEMSSWGFFGAWMDARRVGGAVAVLQSSAVGMTGLRGDPAVLWDLRVAPELRGRGVGGALLAAVENWVVHRGGRRLAVETQNINVLACRFYQRHDFLLERASAGMYVGFPEELQLLWAKDLHAATPV